MRNSDFKTRILSIYESQTSPVDMCMQNSVLTTRINSLYGSQPSLAFIDPRPQLWICTCKAACLPPDKQVSMCSRPRLRICACKTTSLAPELHACIGPSTHLCFFHAKLRN